MFYSNNLYFRIRYILQRLAGLWRR